MTKKHNFYYDFIIILILAGVLLFLILNLNNLEPNIYNFFDVKLGEKASFNIQKLSVQFIEIAFWSSLLSLIFGLILGLFCFTEIGKDFRFVIEQVSSLLRAFPQIAMLRFIIPIMGLGKWPTIIALTIHGVLPIISGVVTGIDNVPKDYIKIATGMGMTKWQTMFKVLLPLSIPVIIAGTRISIISCIGGATIGSQTGAEGLGILLKAGQETYNVVLIFECAIIIGLLSILVDKSLKLIEKKYYLRY